MVDHIIRRILLDLKFLVYHKIKLKADVNAHELLSLRVCFWFLLSRYLPVVAEAEYFRLFGILFLVAFFTLMLWMCVCNIEAFFFLQKKLHKNELKGISISS